MNNWVSVAQVWKIALFSFFISSSAVVVVFLCVFLTFNISALLSLCLFFCFFNWLQGFETATWEGEQTYVSEKKKIKQAWKTIKNQQYNNIGNLLSAYLSYKLHRLHSNIF